MLHVCTRYTKGSIYLLYISNNYHNETCTKQISCIGADIGQYRHQQISFYPSGLVILHFALAFHW